MLRSILIVSMLALAAPAASAQSVFNPALPGVPAPPPPPMPPAATPGMAPPPAVIGKDSRSDQGAANPRIELGGPSRETFNDRSIRCAHQAEALGIRAGKKGQYIRECVNY